MVSAPVPVDILGVAPETRQQTDLSNKGSDATRALLPIVHRPTFFYERVVSMTMDGVSLTMPDIFTDVKMVFTSVETLFTYVKSVSTYVEMVFADVKSDFTDVIMHSTAVKTVYTPVESDFTGVELDFTVVKISFTGVETAWTPIPAPARVKLFSAINRLDMLQTKAFGGLMLKTVAHMVKSS